MNNPNRSMVSSPCVNICALDEDDVCVGCHRSAKEITEWSAMTDSEKRAVLVNVSRREEKYLL